MSPADANRGAALMTFVEYCQTEALALGLRLPAYLLDVARLSLAEVNRSRDAGHHGRVFSPDEPDGGETEPDVGRKARTLVQD